MKSKFSFEDELQSISEKGLRRELKVLEGVDFSSNDYLGYSRNEKIRLGLMRFLSQSPSLGATGSRLISGHSFLFEETESFLASTFNSESALIFGSGFMANLGVIGALASQDTEFFSDELNHASLIAGLKLSKCPVSIFRHNDLNHLSELLNCSTKKRRVVVTESVFSMDGDQVPVGDLLLLCERHGAYLVIDEAHSTGVVGKRGTGVLEDYTFDSESVIAVHTCGKALGASGAFVTSSRVFRDLMVNKARSFIYTTAPTPLAVEHIRLAVSKVTSDFDSRVRLQRHVEHLKEHCESNGWKWGGSHILPIPFSGNEQALEAARAFASRGIAVKPIRSPTVPRGFERVRATLSAAHSDKDIELFANTLKEVLT